VSSCQGRIRREWDLGRGLNSSAGGRLHGKLDTKVCRISMTAKWKSWCFDSFGIAGFKSLELQESASGVRLRVGSLRLVITTIRCKLMFSSRHLRGNLDLNANLYQIIEKTHQGEVFRSS
jgi:hypothetical protein